MVSDSLSKEFGIKKVLVSASKKILVSVSEQFGFGKKKVRIRFHLFWVFWVMFRFQNFAIFFDGFEFGIKKFGIKKVSDSVSKKL